MAELIHGNCIAIRASVKQIEFTRNNEVKLREVEKIERYAEQLKRFLRRER